MAEVCLNNVSVEFGSFVAVDDVSLTIADGEFVVYLGPSGCGKTTTLRAIAGLQDTTRGNILFDGVRVNDQSASERNIAMVFQFVSLYPHLRVAENIVFPLKARGVSRADIKRKLDWVAEIFKLGDDLKRFPGALPPGNRQKVALARAVVREPAVLLLDEPLSAIDEQFREEMRWELGHLQRELAVTTVYVTHDQREAMSLADRIVLMNDSRIVQVDSPQTLFFSPDSVFAGQFIGSPSMNLLPLQTTASGQQLANSHIIVPSHLLPVAVNAHPGRILLGIRPRDIKLISNVADTGYPVTINDEYSVGRERYFSMKIGDEIVQGMDMRTVHDTGQTRVTLDHKAMVFFDADSGRRIMGTVSAS